MYQSFLRYARARYLWVALFLVVISVVIYGMQSSVTPRNGGTWLGFTLGTIGLVVIGWLTYFGVRKRKYRASGSQVEGWLSAHVYLGASLLILATLHSGGEIGWNIHTLAYVLMVMVILSGFYGVYVYRRYPALIAANRGGQSREMYLQQLASVDGELRRTATNTAPRVRDAVLSALDRTALGGGSLDLLRGRDLSLVEIPGSGTRSVPNPGQSRILAFLSEQLAASPGGRDAEVLQNLVNQYARRKALLDVIGRDVRMQWKLRYWLFLHVPLTFGLWGALLGHALSVFFYW
jgi:hypothetical protein